jgi:hypothetical protein
VATYRLTNTGTGTTQRGVIIEQLPQGLATAEGATKVEIPFEPRAAGQTVTKKVVLKATQHVEYEGRASQDRVFRRIRAVSARRCTRSSR